MCDVASVFVAATGENDWEFGVVADVCVGAGVSFETVAAVSTAWCGGPASLVCARERSSPMS